jgi:hypothetical protein
MQGEEAVCEKEPLKIASQVEDRGGRHSETEAHPQSKELVRGPPELVQHFRL